MTGEDYSLEPEETEEERIAREARELEERLAWEESERLRIEQERIDDEHFRRGQAEAKQASVSLLARNFYFSIKDEACTKRVQDWLTEKRDAHEAQQREMYRTIKAELKVCPAPKPINEFAEALGGRGDGRRGRGPRQQGRGCVRADAAARADGARRAPTNLDAFEQTASAARKLKMTEASGQTRQEEARRSPRAVGGRRRPRRRRRGVRFAQTRGRARGGEGARRGLPAPAGGAAGGLSDH